VPDGEHRLSRPEDIALLLDIIDGLVKALTRPGSDPWPAPVV
jgi:hypothetical protein